MVETSRVVLLGISASGKSTLARSLSLLSGAPHVELDGLHWGPNWSARPEHEFRRLTAEAVSGPRWIVDGNYTAVRDIVWPRATAIVWLNYPLWLVLWRVLVRSVKRVSSRQMLWNGNQESFRRSFMSCDSVILWVINAYHRRQREFTELRRSGAFPNASWVEVRHPSEAKALLRRIQGAG